MMMEPIATDQLQTYSVDAVVCKCAARTEIRVAREQASNNQHHLQENNLIKKVPEIHAGDHGCGQHTWCRALLGHAQLQCCLVVVYFRVARSFLSVQHGKGICRSRSGKYFDEKKNY